MSLVKRAALSFSLLAVVACGSTDQGAAPRTDAATDAEVDQLVTPTPDSGGTPDAAKEAGGPFAPATHDAAPQVLSAGGKVLDKPLVVPVFFGNDPMRAGIEDFLSQLATSDYWGATTAEYGVGPIAIAPSVVVNDAPPTSSYAINNWVAGLAAKASAAAAGAGAGSGSGGAAGAGGATGSDAGAADGAAGAGGGAGTPGDAGLADGAGGSGGADAGSDGGTSAPFPAPTPNTLYAIYFPPGATISDSQAGQSCVSYGGYHSETFGSGAGSHVVYAILPRCKHFDGLAGVDAITATTSHELIEAATDPHPNSSPAFAYVDDTHAVWNVQPIGEIGDMCAYEPQSFAPLVGQYYVQRVWSNVAAAAGHDPCVPAPAAPYFNAVPDQPDDLVLTQNGFSVQTRGVKIAVGETRTIDVHLFSDAPTTDWAVQAQDAVTATGGATTLGLSLDKSYGNNGDVFHLTIQRDAAGPVGGSEFMLWSQSPATQEANLWFGYVGD